MQTGESSYMDIMGLVFADPEALILDVYRDLGKPVMGATSSTGTEKKIHHMSPFMQYPGEVSSTGLCAKSILAKDIPSLDYVTVSANRLWGCSTENHEIYSSKQGDATNWYNYGGLATDSYAVTIADEGKFTGAVTYNDMPYFFKDNKAYVIMGTKPKNYELQMMECRGVQDGAYNTIAQKDGYIYYKSNEGVERFNGNTTQSLTTNLDLKGYKGFMGEVCSDKYFVTLGKTKQTTRLYVFDITKGMWHIEEQIGGEDLINLNQNLYVVYDNYKKEDLIKVYGKSVETPTWITNVTPTYDKPKWSITSGEFNGQSQLNKHIEKFMFELKLDEGSDLSISFSYNDSDEWERVFRSKNSHVKKLITVPIQPKRCERLRYKIEGKGKCKIYSITMQIEIGSEI